MCIIPFPKNKQATPLDSEWRRLVYYKTKIGH